MNDANRSIAYTLPNGVKIEARTAGDADDLHPNGGENGFSGIDIVAIYPNGAVETLCCAEYDAECGKLRVFAYDGNSDDMAYECEDYNFYGGGRDVHP